MNSWFLFHFIRPYWLLALVPFCGLFWRMMILKANSGLWQSVCDDELLPHVLIDRPLQHKRWPLVLYGLSGVLVIIALAGPTWERLPVPVFRNDSALVIALDLSRSMDATDIKPSRLERARFKITDILRRRKDGQTALIVYAGDAFVVTPLTDDTETIRSQLPALTTGMMPVQGSRTIAAVKEAVQLLKQAGLNQGAVLLVTDGIDEQATIESVQGLKQAGYSLSVLGVGTAKGAPIPLPQGGFFKNRAGTIVIPSLRQKSLRDVAAAGGGIYQMMQQDNVDLDALDLVFDQRASSGDAAEGSSQIDQWYEAGSWLLLILLPIAALSFRRGYLLVIVLCIVPIPKSHALEWQDLWTTADQQGYRAYQSGDSKGAAESFQNSEWKAAAQYQAKQYQQALETLEGVQSSHGIYNKGNTLAQLGRYQDAIDAYDQALTLEPENDDARTNKAAVEELLQQQEQQEQKQDKSDQDKQDSDSESSDESKSGDPGEDEANKDNDQQSKPSDQNNPDQSQEPTDSESQPQSETGESEESQEEKMNEGEDSEEDQASLDAAKQAEAEQAEKDQQETGEEKAISKVPEASEQPLDEASQANEQWLRRIPDNAGGLLKRKFQYQYRQRSQRSAGDAEAW